MWPDQRSWLKTKRSAQTVQTGGIVDIKDVAGNESKHLKAGGSIARANCSNYGAKYLEIPIQGTKIDDRSFGGPERTRVETVRLGVRDNLHRLCFATKMLWHRVILERDEVQGFLENEVRQETKEAR